jgi:choline dehydrogenase-like flavoprotein
VIVNADEIGGPIETGGTVLQRADICVVGAGPAGITLALALADAGARVLLLESGGRRPDAVSQALCRGEVADPTLHCPPDTYRRRCLGGSTTIWGGRCVPLDPVDFAPRPWLDLPASWPIAHADLIPYWRRAHTVAELGGYDYSARGAVRGGMRPMFPGFASAVVTTDQIERFSRPTDFGRAYANRLASSRAIDVLLNATVTQIILEPGGQAVRHLVCATRAGGRFCARARAYVLAMGGLEVPRLLLASRSHLPNGVGNAHGQVGRHYMCHLGGTVGVFSPAPGCHPFHGYERTEDGVYCRRRLSIEPWAQRGWRIANVIARLHHPGLADPAHRTGAFSALYLARGLLPVEYAAHLGTRRGPASPLPHLLNVARDPLGTARFGWNMLRHRVLAPRRYPSLTVPPRSGRFTLELHAEQLPNPASRVTLSRETDCFGVPRPRIDWRYLPADIRSVQVALGLFAQSLAAGAHGALAFDPERVEADILRDGAYGGHHLGTARMSASPRTGVVDADCRVHGVANLYVAGGAVFATSGQANPTLTILALALCLADHLQQHVLASRRPGALPLDPAGAVGPRPHLALRGFSLLSGRSP